MSPYPCLDDLRRYRSFPCSQCKAASCWMGKKPDGAPRGGIEPSTGYPICEGCGKPVLPTNPRQTRLPSRHPGCPRRCGHCRSSYTPHGRGLYCSERCRTRASSARARARKG